MKNVFEVLLFSQNYEKHNFCVALILLRTTETIPVRLKNLILLIGSQLRPNMRVHLINLYCSPRNQ